MANVQCDHCGTTDEESGIVLTVWQRYDSGFEGKNINLCGLCLSRLVPLGTFSITEPLEKLLEQVDKGY